MSTWFEGSQKIGRPLDVAKRAVEDVGYYFVQTVRRMPGLTSVELVDSGPDFTHIRTSEGLMKRTGITKTETADSLVLEFDEAYAAGKTQTFRSRYRESFVADEDGMTHTTTIDILDAPGILGFFYRHFGSGNIGKAVLASHKGHLESLE